MVSLFKLHYVELHKVVWSDDESFHLQTSWIDNSFSGSITLSVNRQSSPSNFPNKVHRFLQFLMHGIVSALNMEIHRTWTMMMIHGTLAADLFWLLKKRVWLETWEALRQQQACTFSHEGHMKVGKLDPYLVKIRLRNFKFETPRVDDLPPSYVTLICSRQ